MMKENVDPQKFSSLLSKKAGEHDLSKYLGDNPWILYWTFCPASGHLRFLFREFPLGNSFKADFLILNADSGSWRATYIELEPSTSILFNKGRIPAKRLAQAIRQVDNWRHFINHNSDFLRKTYFDWMCRKDILHYSDPVNRKDETHYNILNPESVIFEDYVIIIGRRDSRKQFNNLQGEYEYLHGIKIVTFDRLLDLAKRRYKQREIV